MYASLTLAGVEACIKTALVIGNIACRKIATRYALREHGGTGGAGVGARWCIGSLTSACYVAGIVVVERCNGCFVQRQFYCAFLFHV
jgi:RES domain-containing protein